MATHLFRRHEVAEEKEVGKAVERGRRRALARFVGVGVILALVLLMTSVTSPSAIQAAFPGQNGKIAFNSTQHGEPVQIYLMDANGSNQTRLTFAAGNDSEPAWSPDGSKIAFSTNRPPAPGNEHRIWVMDANGSNQTILTAFNSGRPAWSPDGSKIAFHGIIGGDGEIYVMDANGSNQINLTSTAGSNAHPSWSPDGSKIAFYSSRDGNAEIYVMDADGSNQTRLTTTGATDYLPDWSPDGTKIAFQSDRDGDFEIYVMNADGSNQTRLTFASSNDGWAAWSPDGTKILFNSDRDGDFEIYVMNADGSGQANLTDNSVYDAQPSWQPLLTPTVHDFYLHGTGATGNPPTLFLDNIAPIATTAKYKDSPSVNFSGGNPWKDVGTWTAGSTLSAGTLTDLSDLHAWLGLKNSDDQGTNFDLRAEVYKNGTLVASGETYCITSVTRNPSLAKEVVIAFGSFSPTAFDGTTDVLSLKVLTRIGTNGAGGFCGGHSNAVGLRLYFDATSWPSKFDATFEP